jgi:hypothetical protein
VGRAADVFDECGEALVHPGGFQLVAQDRGERQRQRGAVVQQIE